MKGLLTKEFIMLKKQWFVISLFVLMFGIVGIVSGTPSMMLMIPLFMSVYQSNILADEMSKWQQYAIVLPYGRKNIISSKYFYIAIISLCSTLFITLCYTISALIGRISCSLSECLIILICSLVTGLVYPAIILPLSYKFNSDKGRFLLMIINGSFGGIFAVFSINENVYNSFLGLVDIVKFLPFIALALVVILYIISWQISVKIYEKREL